MGPQSPASEQPDLPSTSRQLEDSSVQKMSIADKHPPMTDSYWFSQCQRCWMLKHPAVNSISQQAQFPPRDSRRCSVPHLQTRMSSPRSPARKEGLQVGWPTILVYQGLKGFSGHWAFRLKREKSLANQDKLVTLLRQVQARSNSLAFA